MSTLTLDLAPQVGLHLAVSEHEGWINAFEGWLQAKPANTVRAYRAAWQELLSVSGKMPWQLERQDVADWVRMMNARGLAAGTIGQRLAAISSFFDFLNQTSGKKHENPAGASVLRPKTQLYKSARYLKPEDARVLLSAINPHTKRGSRDYALFLTYLLTGRRNSEIRQLRWGDLEHSGTRVYYRWEGKGKTRRDELPAPCYQAICNCLRANHRFETISAGDYLFQASSDCASHLPSVGQLDRVTGPLSMHQVQDLLRTYARKAGITSRLRVHDLRHTAAMLRRTAGEDIEEISEFLGHSNLAITQVYLHKVEGRNDTTWKTVGEMLGICDEEKLTHNNRVARNHDKPNRE